MRFYLQGTLCMKKNEQLKKKKKPTKKTHNPDFIYLKSNFNTYMCKHDK